MPGAGSPQKSAPAQPKDESLWGLGCAQCQPKWTTRPLFVDGLNDPGQHSTPKASKSTIPKSQKLYTNNKLLPKPTPLDFMPRLLKLPHIAGAVKAIEMAATVPGHQSWA